MRGCFGLFVSNFSELIWSDPRKGLIASDTFNIFTSLRGLKTKTEEVTSYPYYHKEEIELDKESRLCLELNYEIKIKDLILDGIKGNETQNLYITLLNLLYNEVNIKYLSNSPEDFKKKINTQLSDLFSSFENPSDYLKYSDGTDSKNNSPGYNSEKYLEVILRDSESNLILIDQPEDNLRNRFISEKLVELIRQLKFQKQIFLVTHNPAIVVYGDAESIILASNKNNRISYQQIKLEDKDSQKEICSVLDGGEYIFYNRSQKYNIQRLLEKGINNE